MTITTPNGDDAGLPGPTAGGSPWPGVMVVQESAGMSHDPRNQAYWLASEGYLAAGVDE